MLHDYFKLIIIIELITLINYFIFLQRNNYLNIIFLFFLFNLFSTILYLFLLLNYINKIDYFFYYKLGLFPFHFLYFSIYKYLPLNLIIYDNLFPKFLYFSFLSHNLPSFSLLTMFFSIKYIKRKKIKELLIGFLFFNTAFYFFYFDFWFELLLLSSFHLIFLLNYNFKLNIGNIIYLLSFMGIPPFLGFYKYFFLNFNIFPFFFNLFFSFFLFKLFFSLIPTYSIKNNNLLYLFIIIPLEGILSY